MQKISYVLFFFVFLLILSCSRDLTEPADNSCGSNSSYSTDVKAIIDGTCAYSGCHDGAGGTGPGNYTTYAGLNTVLNNGQFQTRAIDQRNMPPANASGPTVLTDEEIAVLTSWLNAGSPEELNDVTATYDDAVKLIIDNSCGYSGCHDGSGIGNYNSYEGLQIDIELGNFFESVVTNREDPVLGMPPARAVDNGGAPRLTDEEFQIMLCWIENGYLEN